MPPAQLRSLIDSKKVPRQCQHEMIRIMGESIRRRIKKANAQIKATKAAMNHPDYHGMLFLANDGNFIMEMPALIHLVYLATRNDFREIECITLFSGNILSWVEGVPRPTKMWFTLHKDDTTILLTKLAERLGTEWGRHIDDLGRCKLSARDGILQPADEKSPLLAIAIESKGSVPRKFDSTHKTV